MKNTGVSCKIFIGLCGFDRHYMKEDFKMISAGDFRNGLTIEVEGNVFQVIEFQHVKPGKGAAYIPSDREVSSGTH